MKRILAVFILLLLFPSLSFSQVGLGFGIIAPITGGDTPISASIDDVGIVRVDKTLDSSPQLFVEMHRTFSLGGVRVGPAIGFAPKIDFGLATNDGSEPGPGVGFGGVIAFPVDENRSFNISIMILISKPIDQVSNSFSDGFQAPRDSMDNPIDPTFINRSNNRLVIGLTVSGLF